MGADEIIRYILSFLGGGVVSATAEWFRASRSEQRQREIDHLQQQLRFLYGPLHFFTNQANQLFGLARGLHGAYDVEYVQRTWSDDPATQQAIQRDSSTTLRLANEYVAKVNENNERVMRVLEANWNLIDPDDTSIFSQFQVDYVRVRTEREEGRIITPLPIYMSIGEISWIRPEFIKRVESKFREKQDRLKALLR